MDVWDGCVRASHTHTKVDFYGRATPRPFGDKLDALGPYMFSVRYAVLCVGLAAAAARVALTADTAMPSITPTNYLLCACMRAYVRCSACGRS